MSRATLPNLRIAAMSFEALADRADGHDEVSLPVAVARIRRRVHPQVVRRGGAEVGECVEHTARFPDRDHDVAAIAVRPNSCARNSNEVNDAEVAAAALQSHRADGTSHRACLHHSAVRSGHIRADQAVDCQSELSLQATAAAAQA